MCNQVQIAGPGIRQQIFVVCRRGGRETCRVRLIGRVFAANTSQLNYMSDVAG